MPVKNKIRVAIAEDHTLLRKALADALMFEDTLDVTFHVATGSELIFSLQFNPVDVVILDLNMPIMSGTDALIVMREKFPETKVIILSMHHDESTIINHFNLGANAYLYKGCDIDDMLDAIYSVHDNGYYLTESLPKAIIASLIQKKSITTPSSSAKLTEREMAVFQLICQGLDRTEISNKLNINFRTAENHRYNISKKIGTRSSTGMLIYALQNGFARITSDQQIIFNDFNSCD